MPFKPDFNKPIVLAQAVPLCLLADFYLQLHIFMIFQAGENKWLWKDENIERMDVK